MKAHPLYLEKLKYSPSLIFPKFSVLIISSLIKASLIKKVYAWGMCMYLPGFFYKGVDFSTGKLVA